MLLFPSPIPHRLTDGGREVVTLIRSNKTPALLHCRLDQTAQMRMIKCEYPTLLHGCQGSTGYQIFVISSLSAHLHPYLPLFLTIRHCSRLFVAIRNYSPLFATIRTIRYSRLFAVRYSRLFAVRCSLFATIRCSQFGFSRHPMWSTAFDPDQGPVSRKPRKVFGPVKPFFVHLYEKTEKCIRLKLLA